MDFSNGWRWCVSAPQRMCVLCVLVLSGQQASGAWGSNLEDAAALLETHQYAEAYRQFEAIPSTASAADRFVAQLGRADAARALGMHGLALQALQRAAILGSTITGAAEQVHARIGSTLLAIGAPAPAAVEFEKALAGSGSSNSLKAAAHNDLGVMAAESGDHARAAIEFKQALETARASGDLGHAANAACNALKSRIADKQLLLDTAFADAQAAVSAMDVGLAQAELQVSLAASYRTAQRQLGWDVGSRMSAFDLLQAARASSEAADDPVLLAGIYGQLALLYDDEGRTETALVLAQRALFEAQRSGWDEIIYRWDWLLGRLLVRSGDLLGARQAYARAVSALNRVRPSMAGVSAQGFSERIAPVYSEYSDVLLRLAGESNSAGREVLLSETRQVIEDLKQAEVEDYFASTCVGSMGEVSDRPPGKVGLIYPLLLEERVEILLEAGGSVSHFTVPVSRAQVTETVRRFRVNLQNPARGDAYLTQARSLYEWLIAPVESALKRGDIDTLVIVPDGPLRTIPIGALHDGNRFVIERLAVSVTPSMRYTRFEQPDSHAPVMLVGGLSAGVQGYPALPHVSDEVQALSRQYSADAMTDEEFSLEPVSAAMAAGGYNVVHLATHGEFRSDYRQSFLLTYDDRLTLERLESTLDARPGSSAPLDLLVLSACQTAVGDDRAALGLAGVAIQSGAISALASLWSVSDPGTAELMKQFYRNLQAGLGKSRSLQEAQESLLKTSEYAHPAYWAPFTLVGSWQ